MRQPPRRAALEPHAYRRLIEACVNALPDEACGVLSGAFIDELLTITDVHPITNAAPAPRNNFAFDPADWVRTLYDMQKNRQSLVGFYHSHPASLPVPSPADLRGLPAGNAGASYWIISPHQPVHETIIRPYWLQGEIFTPLMLA